MNENAISRREFLKKAACGFVGLAALLKLGGVPFVPETIAKEENGTVQSAEAPLDHSKMWLNTGTGVNSFGANGSSVPSGALCYWDENGSGWKPTAATWA